MQSKVTVFLMIGGILLAILLGAAQQQQAEQAQPDPRTERATPARPQRIVSMSPGNTEILFALGAGDRVVGVTSYSDYPEEAKTKTSIGGYHAPDVEKIVALSPDIVFAMGEIQATYIKILQQAGIKVISVEPKTLPEILTAIGVIGKPASR